MTAGNHTALKPPFRTAIRHHLAEWIRVFSPSQQGFLFVLAILGVLLLYLQFHRPFSPSLAERPHQEFVVEVTGDGGLPGIYFFEKPPSLRDVIEKAGGRREGIPADNPDLSMLLETGTLVSARREPSGTIRLRLGRMEAHKLLLFSIPIDLNEASVEDLCLVPGIGPSLAKEIVAYRERREGFSRIEDLQHVRGIGEKTYQRIQGYLSVR